MKPAIRICVAASMLAGVALNAHADVITDWNIKAGEIVTEAKLGTPPAIRAMAIVQTAVHDAVIAVKPGASIDAAVAAANRATLTKLMPAQQASIDAAYQAALAQVSEGPAKAGGIAVGESAAAAVFAQRANDKVAAVEAYRPHTTAGVYVPTAAPAAPQWAQRAPWLMTNPAQFRPGLPPALTSVVWAREYNEVKELGSKGSTKRSAEQTETARFWEYSLPQIYHGVVRSVAIQPGRDVARNARLFAAVTQAMDDAIIGVFEAKYQYNFWRPATAIRNGDIDGNEATARDASWLPFIDTPMHPEYPCAHCIVAASLAAVLQAEVGDGPMPTLTTTSPTAPGVVRSWTRVDDLVQEMSNARIYDGVHYRTSTEVGAAMGKKIGELAATTLLR